MKLLVLLIASLAFAEVPQKGKFGDVSYEIVPLGGAAGWRVEMRCPDTTFDMYVVTAALGQDLTPRRLVAVRNSDGPVTVVEIRAGYQIVRAHPDQLRVKTLDIKKK